LTGRSDYIKAKPHIIRNFVSALVEAERFLEDNPERARKMIVDSQGVEEVWKGTLFSVGLDHSLVLSMEAAMRWTRTNDESDLSDGPDLPGFFYFDALNSVRPKSIKILH